MRLVLISDTHGRHPHLKLPDGDILIHAGDATSTGTREELMAFNKFIAVNAKRYKQVIFIAGNHDLMWEQYPMMARIRVPSGIYLQDSGHEFEGVKFWGSPVTPTYGSGWAFNVGRGGAIKMHWDLIPDDTDVLITHGPPYGILDSTKRGDNAGCEELLLAIQRVKPKVVVFGHIHECGGQALLIDGTYYVNAAVLDHKYKLTNAPVVIDI